MEGKVANIFVDKSNTVSVGLFGVVAIEGFGCIACVVELRKVLQTDPDRLALPIGQQTVLSIVIPILLILLHSPFVLIYFEVAVQDFLGAYLSGFLLGDRIINLFWFARLQLVELSLGNFYVFPALLFLVLLVTLQQRLLLTFNYL